MKLVDLTGKKFGEWEVHEYSGGGMWLCRCSCGTMRNVNGGNLRQGKSTNCGCIKGKGENNPYYKHGKRHTRLWSIWQNMKSRCYNTKVKSYQDYGGRGVYVCGEWKNDFEAFYTWAMNNGYADNLTIDRINNEKGYEPSNCRWVTRKEQNYNRRKRRWAKRPVEITEV